ncbi:MAG: hypothetical protein PVH29_10800 [Candidatus Zixiibacteriota bacterium]|jgi:hypothetical protein
MKRIGLVVALSLVGAAAWGVFGELIASFPGPGTNPSALAWDGEYLWCTTQTPDYTFRLDPGDGSIVSSYTTGFGYSARGLTWADSSIYDGRYSPDSVNRRTTSGSIISSFLVDDIYGGLAYDGSYFWVTSNTPRGFWQYTTDGSLVSSFSISFPPFDPGWDGTYLYCGSYSPTHTVYQLTTTGSIVATLSPPAGYPWGCCSDGTYLWIATTVGSHYIWKLDLGDNAVAPSSIGKVKAIFY